MKEQRRDRFLQEETKKHEGGFVPFSVLFTFKKLAALTVDGTVLQSAISDSNIVELNEGRDVSNGVCLHLATELFQDIIVTRQPILHSPRYRQEASPRVLEWLRTSKKRLVHHMDIWVVCDYHRMCSCMLPSIWSTRFFAGRLLKRLQFCRTMYPQIIPQLSYYVYQRISGA